LNYFNYFSEIEETFIRRRGRNLLLSPLDWALIETWQERGIPLRIVLRGIEKVFDGVDKQPAQKRTVKSLIYCREEIEAQYAEWLETQVGKNGEQEVQSSKFKVQSSQESNLPKSDLFSDEAINAHLEKAAADLKEARQKAETELSETLGSVLQHLLKLKQNSQTVETLEKSLEKLDGLIDESLLKYSETEKLKVEIEKQIASYKNKMESEVYRRTFDLMLLKRLRERAEIPRLSLFYL
jgi:hypothetical protein